MWTSRGLASDTLRRSSRDRVMSFSTAAHHDSMNRRSGSGKLLASSTPRFKVCAFSAVAVDSPR